MGVISSLLNSLVLPRKKAVLHLNKVKVMSSIFYFIFLIFIVTLPDLIKLFLTYQSQFQDVPLGIFIVQILVFYPFINIFIGLIGISLMALGGILLNKILKRKLKYPHLWKMSIHASTVPLLLYALLRNLLPSNGYYITILMVLAFYILYKMITVYPKPKNK